MRFMAMARVSCAFLADRAERHRSRGKALHDFTRWLYFCDRNWIGALLQLHQTAQRRQVGALVVDEVGVFLEGLRALLPHCLLQLADRQRIQQVILAIDALMVRSSDREFGLGLSQGTECVLVLQLRFAGEHFETTSLQTRRRFLRSRNPPVLCSARWLRKPVRPDSSVGRDTHLCEGLQQALVIDLMKCFTASSGVTPSEVAPSKIPRAAPGFQRSPMPDKD